MKNNKLLICIISTVILLSVLISGCSLTGTGNADSTGSVSLDAGKSETQQSSSSSAENTVSGTSVITESGSEYNGIVEFSDSSTGIKGSVTISDNIATISSAGTYLITGSIGSGQIIVDADKDNSVTLVLQDLTLTSTDGPAIWAKSGELTIISTGENTLTDSLTYTLEDGTDEPNACIYSKDDLTISGTGSLTVNANYYIGIESKDDLIIDNGNITVSSADDALRGHDSLTVSGGTLDLKAGADGLKANNDSDTEKGYITILGGNITIVSSDDGIDAANDITISGGSISITSDDDAVHTDTSVYISGGDISVECGDDAIHAEADLTITGGTLDLTGHEGLEGCTIQIADGTVTVYATDDAINATYSNGNTVPNIVIDGGEISVTVAAGDTDALDSNGNLIINGGTINISAQSPFDFDGQGQLNGGTVYVNGTQITSLTSQMMGGMGGPMGGMNGQQMPQGGEGWQNRGPGGSRP
ncbi:MAG: carbohydrate-binding domain-containing protein [Oscillospiraceae bacterium]|nr:carbohydrate-binding domain-containing protein [Oscillospiraceae bacterium]